jgi:5-methylcytosine-specific restriction endonuclease McrA
MNERKTLEIIELKATKWHSQGGVCQVCGEPVSVADGELAHRIPNRKWCLAKYGTKVLHHALNLVLTHPGRCNDAVSISNHPVEMEKLVAEINKRLKE